jgi:hypothetical protein
MKRAYIPNNTTDASWDSVQVSIPKKVSIPKNQVYAPKISISYSRFNDGSAGKLVPLPTSVFAAESVLSFDHGMYSMMSLHLEAGSKQMPTVRCCELT